MGPVIVKSASRNKITSVYQPPTKAKREEDFLDKIPSGFEKDLIRLMKDPNPNNEIFKSCEQKLLEEGFLDEEEIKMKFESVREGKDPQNKLQEILENHVQIVKLRIIHEILKDHERGINSVKNKDIVLFFGKTGCGKSTTILYLLGCQMKMNKKNKKIDAVNKRQDLFKIQPSNDCRSGTKFLETVGYESMKDFNRVYGKKTRGKSIDFKLSPSKPIKDVAYDYGNKERTDDIFINVQQNAFESLKNFDETKYMDLPLFVDSPGFGDTDGIEVEMANQIAILRAMQSCKSMKIVALISKADMEKKLEGIKKMCQELSKFFNGFEELLKHVIIDFPDYKKENDLKELIKNVDEYFQIVQKDDPTNKSLLLFLQKIIQTINTPQFKSLDPLDKKASNFLQKIFQIEPLNADRLKILVNSKLPDKFTEKIKKYFDIKLKQIPYLVNLKNFEMLDFILEDLSNLFSYEELKLYSSEVKGIRSKTFELVRKALDAACEDLKYLELDQDVLKDNDQEEFSQNDSKIRNFKEFIEKLSHVENLSQFRQSDIFLGKEVLQNSFRDKLKELNNRVTDLELQDEKFSIICKNIEMLKKKYKLDPQWFRDLENSISEKFFELEENRGIPIEQLTHEELIDNLRKKQQEIKQYGEIIERVSSGYKNELNKRIDKITDITEIKEKLSNPNGTDPDNITNMIQEKLSLIELCKNHNDLQEFGIEIGKSLKTYSDITEALKNFYNNSYGRLHALNSIDDAHFNNVYQELSQMEKWLFVMHKFMSQEEDLRTKYSEFVKEMNGIMKNLTDFLVFKLGQTFEDVKERFSMGYELIRTISFELEDLKMIFDILNAKIENKIRDDFARVQEFEFIRYDQIYLEKFLVLYRAASKKDLIEEMAFDNKDIANLDLNSLTKKKLFEEIGKFSSKNFSLKRNIDTCKIKEYYDFLNLLATNDFSNNNYIKEEAENVLAKFSEFIANLHRNLKESLSNIINLLKNNNITHSNLLKNNEDDPVIQFSTLKKGFETVKIIEDTYPKIIGPKNFILEILLNELLQTLGNYDKLHENSAVFIKYQEFDGFYPIGTHYFLDALNSIVIEKDEQNFHESLKNHDFMKTLQIVIKINQKILARNIPESEVDYLISRMQKALSSTITELYQELQNEMGDLVFSVTSSKNLEMIKPVKEKIGKLFAAQEILLKDSEECKIRGAIQDDIEFSEEKFKKVTKKLWDAFDEFLKTIYRTLEDFDLSLYETLFQNIKDIEGKYFEGVNLSNGQGGIRKESAKRLAEVLMEKNKRLEKKVLEKVLLFENFDNFSKECKLSPPKKIWEKLIVIEDQSYAKNFNATLLKQIDSILQKIGQDAGDYDTFQTKLMIFEPLTDQFPENLIIPIRNLMDSSKKKLKQDFEQKTFDFKNKLIKLNLTKEFEELIYVNVQQHKVFKEIFLTFLRSNVLKHIMDLEKNRVKMKDIVNFCNFFENLQVLKEEIQKELRKIKEGLKKKLKLFCNDVEQMFQVNLNPDTNLQGKFTEFLELNEQFLANKNPEAIILEGFNEIVELFHASFHLNLEKNFESFQQILKIDHDFWQKLSEFLQIASRIEPLLKFLKNSNQFKKSQFSNINLDKYFFESMLTETKSKLDVFLKELKSKDIFKFRTEQDKRHFFISLTEAKQSWNFLTKKFSRLSEYQNRLEQNIQQFIENIKKDVYNQHFKERKFFEINEILQFLQLYCDHYLDKKDPAAYSIVRWLADSKKELFIHLINLQKETQVMLSFVEKDTQIIEMLVEIKNIAVNIPNLKEKANRIIDHLFAELSQKRSNQGGNVLISFVDKLKHYDYGQIIISEHAIFKDLLVYLYNLKNPRKTFDEIKDSMEGDLIKENMQTLKAGIQSFDKHYHELNEKFLLKDEKDLINEFNEFCQSSSLKNIKNYKIIKNNVPKLLAYIFSLYTILNAKFYRNASEKDRSSSFLFHPHPAQIVSILRIFGCDNNESNFENNLVQIGTGEGKSITMAAVSCIFALIGYDVKCACYSQILCDRDYENFKDLYEKFGVNEHIYYGTFNNICEAVLNELGNIRQLVENKILKEETVIIQKDTPERKILIIDEVDVFFSPQYYGQLYNPIVKISHQNIKDLINYIWENQENKLALDSIANTDVYHKSQAIFKKQYESLLEQALSQLKLDLKNYKDHDYVNIDNKIGYKEHDTINFNICYGYKTLFAYLLKLKDGYLIQSEALEKAKSLLFSCGQFSYAELAKEHFPLICGVTGTLKTLNADIKKELADNYKITKYTYTPSVFKDNKVSFNESQDVKIVNQNNYFVEISNEIARRRGGENGIQRPVIVVFETRAKLAEYYNHISFDQFKKDSNVLDETRDKDIKKQIIERATKRAQVTLIESSFGRGTDFILRDEDVIQIGGVHILQVFFSKEISEEIQIKGRTARQGDPGSYSLVLLDSDLEYYFKITQERINSQPVNEIWADLKLNREVLSKKGFELNQELVRVAKRKHDSSKTFLEQVRNPNGNSENILKFLKEENRGGSFEKVYKTLILMDGTASMGNLLQTSLKMVYQMFERAIEISRNNGFSPECFLLQFAIYRNYDLNEDRILEKSAWENSPEKIRNFLQSKQAYGGRGNEAIEIGFSYANKIEDLSQIILIGDSRANCKDEVMKKREKKGRNYWANTIYSKPTFYRDELKLLQQKGIKIHSFYVKSESTEKLDSVRENFIEISKTTKGKCKFLDLTDIKTGTEQLTNMVTMEILSVVDERLANAYKNAYGYVD